MKNDDAKLMILRVAAGLALLTGVLMSLQTVLSLQRTRDVWTRKIESARTLLELKARTDRQDQLLAAYARSPASTMPADALCKSALPDQAMTVLATGSIPAVPGWAGRRTTIQFRDLPGESLDALFEAGTRCSPPWELVECTLIASGVPGRFSKATIILETVERTGN